MDASHVVQRNVNRSPDDAFGDCAVSSDTSIVVWHFGQRTWEPIDCESQVNDC
jgi:hypothetical protein